MSGSKLEKATDFSTSDGRLEIVRHYRSFEGGDVGPASRRVIGLGGGWRFGFAMELHFYGLFDGIPALAIMAPDGSAHEFYGQPDGTFPPAGATPGWSLPSTDYKLERVGAPPVGSYFDVTTQWKVTDSESRVWILQTFSDVNRSAPRYEIARPVQIIDRDGYTITLSYGPDGALQTVADSFGRAATFTWHLYYLTALAGIPNTTPVPLAVKSIALPDGTTLNYDYDPAPSLTAPSTTMPRRLIKAERRNAGNAVVDFTQYHYEDSRFETYLTGITDGRNQRYANFAYDDLGRAVLSEHIGPAGPVEKYTVTYATMGSNPTDFLRTVTNPLGKQTIYRFRGTNSGNQKLVAVEGQSSANCVASNSVYAYDASQFLQSITDEEGRVTRYTRDTKGRADSNRRRIWHARCEYNRHQLARYPQCPANRHGERSRHDVHLQCDDGPPRSGHADRYDHAHRALLNRRPDADMGLYLWHWRDVADRRRATGGRSGQKSPTPTMRKATSPRSPTRSAMSQRSIRSMAAASPLVSLTPTASSQTMAMIRWGG